MRFTSPEAEERYDALVAVASYAVVGLDFDGTLAPIVDDPEIAHIHPDAPAVLMDLAAVVRGRRGDHRSPGAQGAGPRWARRGGPADR